MKKIITGLIVMVLLLGAVACAAPPMSAPRPAPAMEEAGIPPPPGMPPPQIEMPPRPVPMPAPAPAPMPGREGGGSYLVTNGAGQTWATERMIVRTGDISLVVEDVPATMERITEFADSYDGYVVSSRSWKERERLIGTIAIRVPAEHFTEVMRALRGLAVEVASESTSSKDVTEEYVDLSSRLGNLEASEAQLLKLMEQAGTVSDILGVQKELARTRGEIEQAKGRMQYLEQTSSTSLIEVHLEQSKLEVKLTASNRTVKGRDGIWFHSEVAGGFTPYSYEWDFGDGDTSTDAAPTHAYKDDGSYTVTLKVTDDRGNTDTETRDDYITVLPGWNPGGIAGSAWNGLTTFGKGLVNVLIWVGIFSPVWIVIGGIVYWWFWWRKRRK